jgi:hypothetical protein
VPNFTPPYPLFFNPDIAQSGAPSIADRPDLTTRASWFVHLRSNSSAPSSALALRSFGVQSQPVDDSNRGRLWTRNTQLFISTSINIRVPFFFSSGVFAGARTAAVFRYFIEEFDSSFRFVRAVTMPGELVVVREDTSWFSGSQTFTPRAVGSGWTIPNPPGGILTARPNFFYRVWVDLTIDIRAQGFGGLGGSTAIAQLGWDVESMDVQFV